MDHFPCKTVANYGNDEETHVEDESRRVKKVRKRQMRKKEIALRFEGGLFESISNRPKGRKNKCNLLQYEGTIAYKSIIKRHSNKNLNVSFADEDVGDLVSIKEFPPSYWKGVKANYSPWDIITEYQLLCAENNAFVSDVIIEQLLTMKNNRDYSTDLTLFGVCVPPETIESLEAIFKMATFRCMTVYVNNLCKVTATDLFEMISFYDPVKELILWDFPKCFDPFIWDTLANTIKECDALSAICLQRLNIQDEDIAVFFNTINTKSNIVTLHFDGCDVGTAPNFNLACYLNDNNYLQEIYLCYTNISHKEAEIFGKFIAKNSSLKVLDLSNNKLGDRGLNALARGLCEQAYRGVGLQTLILIGNRITKASALTLCNIISNCPLKVLNLGYNNLSDVVLIAIKDDVADSKTLISFGLQCTFISCTGLYYLTEACTRNKNLKHLNLKGNKRIQTDSLNGLADSIHRTNLIKIDLDICSKSVIVAEEFVDALDRVHSSVKANKSRLELSSAGSLDIPDFSYHGAGSHSKPTSSGRFRVVAVPERKSSTRYNSTLQIDNVRDLSNAVSVIVTDQSSTSLNNEAHVPHFQECGDLPDEAAGYGDDYLNVISFLDD